jgi:hypothetical protein
MSRPLSAVAEYEAQGYARHHNEIDAEVSRDIPCLKCGGECEYIGLALWPASGAGMWVMPKSYIAISRCKKCGNEAEF